jgi:two-component system chemotaxis response regulator CheY
MSKRIVLVGHCGPDSSYLRMTVSRARRDLQVIMADDKEDLARAIEQGADLLLLNRQLDWGFDETEGTALISSLRARHPQLKMMLVSNYPEAQAEALAAGALPGFGKRELGTERVTKLLREALLEPAAPHQK